MNFCRDTIQPIMVFEVRSVTIKGVKTGPRDSHEEADGDSCCRVGWSAYPSRSWLPTCSHRAETAWSASVVGASFPQPADSSWLTILKNLAPIYFSPYVTVLNFPISVIIWSGPRLGSRKYGIIDNSTQAAAVKR